MAKKVAVPPAGKRRWRATGRKPSRRVSVESAIADGCERRFKLVIEELDKHELRLAAIEKGVIALATLVGAPL